MGFKIVYWGQTRSSYISCWLDAIMLHKALTGKM